MSEINQEYVNQNIDKIVEFMKICEPEKARKNSRNWRFSLLKDYKSKIHIIVCYQNYTECENMKNQWSKKCDEFYEREDELNHKEKELDQRIMNEENRINKMEEHEKTWRSITQSFRSKLKENISKREYDIFIDEELNYESYYGL